MDKIEKENRIKVNINKFHQFAIFRKLKEPEIKIKNKIRAHSLISAIKNRKKDMEKIFDKTKFKNEEQIKYEENLKKKKYPHLTKSRNVFPLMKEEINNFNLSQNEFSMKRIKTNKFISFSIGKKSNKSLNHTNMSLKTNTTTEKTSTINNTDDTSNVFLTNNRDFSNEQTTITHFKTFEKNAPFNKNKNKIHSYKSRNIRLKYGNNNLQENNQKNPKKLLDFNSIDLTKSNQNLSNFKTIQSLDGSNISNITENILKRRKSIDRTILEIEEKNSKTHLQLKELIKDWHFFPIITNSFKNDINDIIDKTVEIKRNGRYELRKFHQNEIYKKIYQHYWDYIKNNNNYQIFREKQQQEIKKLNLKIRDDFLKAEKLKINLKYKYNFSPSLINKNIRKIKYE